MAAGRIVLAPYYPARDRDNRLVPGAKLFVRVNGTTDPAPTFEDEDLTTPQEYPVVANSSGQFPAVWVEAGTTEAPIPFEVQITGPGGQSIGNPSTFTTFYASFDYGSAAVVLAENAAAQAVTALEDVEVAIGSATDILADAGALVQASEDATTAAILASAEAADAAAAVAVIAGDVDLALTAADQASLDAAQALLDAGDAVTLASAADMVAAAAQAAADLASDDAAQALLDAGDALDAANLKASKAGDTFTGPVEVPLVRTVTAPTSNITGDYGLIDPTGTVGALVQGSQSAPITTESYNKPAVYIERHVAGRNSEPPAGLTDDFLDSNWLLAPSHTVQTIVHANGSNANASTHARIISNTAVGTPPTATNPSVLSQIGVDLSVNCLVASVHTVHTNAPSGEKARPGWAMNSEARWTTGLAPDNLVIMEGDMINTGGGASGPLPSGGNNFTGAWFQSAPRGTSAENKKYGTTGVYISDAGIAGMGWHAGIVMRTNIGTYGAYFENTSTTDSPTGVFLSGAWNYGLRAVGNFATSGLKFDSEAGGFMVDIRNAGTATGAGGLIVNINRANDDTVALAALSSAASLFTVSGDSTNPVRMLVDGQFRRISRAALSSLSGANEVLYCL